MHTQLVDVKIEKECNVGSSMDQVVWGEAETLVVWVTILVMMVVVAIYVIGKVRTGTEKQEPKASKLLSKFRELHSRGVLSDAEFRTIKTTLSAQLQKELKDNDETD